MGTVTWLVMLAAGVGSLILLKKTSGKIEPWLERFGAASFLAAGSIGATGQAGALLNSLSTGVVGIADRLGQSAFGAGVVWIGALALGIAWVGAMIPRWFGWNYPDLLILAGFFLPSLLQGTPDGPLGNFLREFTELAADIAIYCVSWLLGGSPQG